MTTPPPFPPAASGLNEALETARSLAREQLAAAWQLHTGRVEKALHAGWRADLEKLLDTRFAELARALDSTVAAQLAQAVEAARAQERLAAGRAVTGRLNQAARRLRLAERQQEWSAALADAAADFGERAAVLILQGEQLRLERALPDLPEMLIPLSDAAALREAVESLEPVVAVRSASQISPALEALAPVAPDSRVYLFPLAAFGRPVGVLLVEATRDRVDPSALELMANLASAVWEIRAVRSAGAPSPLVSIQGVGAPAVPGEPVWEGEIDRDLEMRARRFARVQVAEMRLYKSAEVERGRAERTLYRLLQPEIDRAREAYRTEFLAPGSPLPDYLHREMVETLAHNDPALLGEAYPGALV